MTGGIFRRLYQDNNIDNDKRFISDRKNVDRV